MSDQIEPILHLGFMRCLNDKCGELLPFAAYERQSKAQILCFTCVTEWQFDNPWADSEAEEEDELEEDEE